MTKKNLNLKTTQIWGKGGSMRTFIFLFLFTLFVNSIAFAGGRSSAGGGKIEKFDFGNWATNEAIQLGSNIVGSAIAQGLGSAFAPKNTGNFIGDFSKGFSSTLSFQPMPEDLTLTTKDIGRVNALNLSDTLSGADIERINAVNLPGVEKLTAENIANAKNSFVPATTVTLNNFGKFASNAGGTSLQPLAASARVYSNLPAILSNYASNYANSFSTGQIYRATAMAGNYYGWKVKNTVLASNIIAGAVSGGINPGQFGVDKFTGESIVTNGLDGMVLGGIGGTVEGVILSNTLDKKGKMPAWAQPAAALAGNFTTGYLVGGLMTQPQKQQGTVYDHTPVAYDKYMKSGNYVFGPVSEVGFAEKVGDTNKIKDEIITQSSFSFNNEFNPKAAFKNALYKGVVPALPSAAVSWGVNSWTKGMTPENANLTRALFNGAYPIANKVGGGTDIKNPALEGNYNRQ